MTSSSETISQSPALKTSSVELGVALQRGASLDSALRLSMAVLDLIHAGERLERARAEHEAARLEVEASVASRVEA